MHDCISVTFLHTRPSSVSGGVYAVLFCSAVHWDRAAARFWHGFME